MNFFSKNILHNIIIFYYSIGLPFKESDIKAEF